MGPRRLAGVGQRAACNRACQFDPAQHIAQAITGQLMIDQELSALLAFVTVLQGHLEGCAGQASKYLRHMGASVRPGGGLIAVIVILERHRETDRHPDVVEINFALRQCALTDLVEWLTA